MDIKCYAVTDCEANGSTGLLYPRSNEFERGGYWFDLVCLSVHLSVCPSVDRIVSTVSSTILAGLISYLQIL